VRVSRGPGGGEPRREPLLASATGAGAGLWRRRLTFGPAAEFCLPAGGRLELPAELEVLAVGRMRLPDHA
jgi:hypothetical protein